MKSNVCVAAGVVEPALYAVTVILQLTAASTSPCSRPVAQPKYQESRAKLMILEPAYAMESELAPEAVPMAKLGSEWGMTPLTLSPATPGWSTPKLG